MTIEPIGRVDSNTTSLIELQQLWQMTHVRDRHVVQHDLDGLAVLTAGDRELFTNLYGPGLLTAGVSTVERFGAPQLLLDVIADRLDGHLPAGTELSSSYLEARFEAHRASAGTDRTTGSPLTEQNLADARTYFERRPQGATIDLQA